MLICEALWPRRSATWQDESAIRVPSGWRMPFNNDDPKVCPRLCKPFCSMPAALRI